jgi:phosphoribosylformylglycinamidine synthase
MDYEKRVQAAAREIVAAGFAESAHDLSDGGLAVALAECAFSPAHVGAALELASVMRPEFLLFHEGPSRILISTAAPDQVQRIAHQHGVEAPLVGATIEGGIRIRNRGQVLLDCPIQPLRERWEQGLEEALEAPLPDGRGSESAAEPRP